jgi:hypothetical protein
VQSYEEDVRRLTESFDAALSTLTQDLGYAMRVVLAVSCDRVIVCVCVCSRR